MSYDIELQKDDKTVEVELHREGGTYAVNGTTEACLNITWNYSVFYYRHIDENDGIRWLYGRKAKDCIKRLENAIGILGTHQYRDYWAPTEGNAGYALSILLKWAKQHPEAVFDGD